MNAESELRRSIAIARAIGDGTIMEKVCKIKAYNPEEFVYSSPFRRLGSSWNGMALAACRTRKRTVKV